MPQFDLLELAYKICMIFVPFLFALCFHEFAHGLVAKWKGDKTAELSGRLTLNPMAHADPIGTWLLPLSAILLGSNFFFGWAKPVPVNSRNLARPKQDMFWIALAGPLSNIFLALVATIIMGMFLAFSSNPLGSASIRNLISQFMVVNLFLAVFNLIPIHPLDGGKVIEPFIPYAWNRWLEENQSMLSMFLLVFLLMAGGILAIPVSIAFDGLMRVSAQIAMLLA